MYVIVLVLFGLYTTIAANGILGLGRTICYGMDKAALFEGLQNTVQGNAIYAWQCYLNIMAADGPIMSAKQ